MEALLKVSIRFYKTVFFKKKFLFHFNPPDMLLRRNSFG